MFLVMTDRLTDTIYDTFLLWLAAHFQAQQALLVSPLRVFTMRRHAFCAFHICFPKKKKVTGQPR